MIGGAEGRQEGRFCAGGEFELALWQHVSVVTMYCLKEQERASVLCPLPFNSLFPIHLVLCVDFLRQFLTLYVYQHIFCHNLFMVTSGPDLANL